MIKVYASFAELIQEKDFLGKSIKKTTDI